MPGPAATRDQAELAAFQPREQPVRRSGSGTLAMKGFVDVTGQADGAHRVGGGARELLRPAGQVQLRVELGEGGLPEFRLREMEGVRTGAGKHAKPSFGHLRRLGEPCAEVLWLPL